MYSVINVAPHGDMVIAVGKGEIRKLARVSSHLLRIASPVFDAMVGPSFKEGQSTHDTSNPLELPDDDPVAMINLCQILHWNRKLVLKSESGWLQKLAVACDKYCCAQKLSDFFQVNMTGQKFSTIDEFIMWAVVGNVKKFGELSEQVLRTPQLEVEANCHKGLLQLLPATMLRDMKDYRQRARWLYNDASQKPITSMYEQAAANPAIDTLCIGLQNRLAGYYKALIVGSIITKNVTQDTALPDMREYLTSNFCRAVGLNGITNELEKHRCRKPCIACNWNSAVAISDAVKEINVGVTGQCKLCFLCFQGGKFAIARDCKEHGIFAGTQSKSTATVPTAPASAAKT